MRPGNFIDAASLHDLLAGPGMDTRTWVSYGTVDLDGSEEDRAVSFDEDLGPLVRVVLHPGENIVHCRVAMGFAGSLEGEWSPFVGGDEVLVVIPGGDEISTPAIVGRMANGLDKFPVKVAGKEVANNNLAFARMRPPYVVETASGYMIRSAVTGAMIGIDESGNITVRDGESAGFQFSAHGFVLQDGSGSGQFVLDTERGFASLWYGGSVVKASSNNLDIMSGGNIGIAANGSIPIFHAMAAEQAVYLMQQYLVLLTAALGVIGATPLTGASLAAVLSPIAGGGALMTGAIAACGLNTPPFIPVFYGAIQTALAVSPPGGAVTPATPGLACPALYIG